LHTHSNALQKALEWYNTVAAARNPPAPKLSWDQVVGFAFLADFNLLRHSRQDICEKPWASPSNRAIRDQYFKIQRAQEEIEWLNVKIRQVVTYMEDEETFLKAAEDAAAQTDLQLAHQIALYHMECGRAFSIHQSCFQKLANNPRFTGTTVPGRSVHLPPVNTSGLIEPEGPGNDGDGSEIDSSDPDSDDEADEETDADIIAFKLFSISLDDADTNNELGD
jgi:hypothetical protein